MGNKQWAMKKNNKQLAGKDVSFCLLPIAYCLLVIVYKILWVASTILREEAI